MAAILRGTFRESDILGRVGGDEFAALVVDSTEDTIPMFLDRLKRSTVQHSALSGRPFSFLMSVGVAHFDPENPCSMEELISRADTLMYLEKKGKQGQ
jgi:two-component system, cell cycle response regulator